MENLFWLLQQSSYTEHARESKMAFQQTCSSIPQFECSLQGSFHYFLAKDLGTDNKWGGGERGVKKIAVKSDWLTSKSPIPLFIWTLPSHSAWMPARETVLLFLDSPHFFAYCLLLYSLWFSSNTLLWRTFHFLLMVAHQSHSVCMHTGQCISVYLYSYL